MKLLLDVNDDKAAFFIEMISNFSFVKAEPLTPYKEGVLKNLSVAVDEMNLVKEGKKDTQALEEFLGEL